MCSCKIILIFCLLLLAIDNPIKSYSLSRYSVLNDKVSIKNFPIKTFNDHSLLYESSKHKNIEKINFSSVENYTKSNDILNKNRENNLFDSENLSVNAARIVLIVVSALYGTNFGCVKVLGEAMDPSVAALCRFTVASLVFSPYVLKVAKNNFNMVLGGFEVGIYSALGYWGQAIALKTSSASSTAFICSLAVIVVPILDMLFSNKASKKPWYEPIIPAVIAVLGVGCLELGGKELPGIGDIWSLAQPIFFGVSFWRIEKHMKSSTGAPGEAQAFTGAMMFAVAIGSFIWALFDFIQPLHGNIPAVFEAVKVQLSALQNKEVLAAIAWTGVMTTAVTSYGENIAMKRLSAAESTIIYSTEPIWGTLFAYLALHESVGWNTLIGAALVISACLWSTLGPTLSIAGALSYNKAAAALIVEEIMENIIVNWTELLSKFGFTPDL